MDNFSVSGFDDGTETFVYVCNLCGQPLPSAQDTCNSGAHVGPYNGGKKGEAIKSTELVRDIAAARKLHSEEQARSADRLRVALNPEFYTDH